MIYWHINANVRLLINRLRFAIGIKRTRYFFSIILFEKYKKIILGIRIFLTFVALFSAFIIFQSTIYAFLFGFLIFVLTSILEKTLFSYRTMYIHPLPEFEIKNEKWVGCFFGYAQPLDQTIKIPLIGIAISDVEYARLIHGLLLKWTMGELNDNAKNITVRVIVDNPQEYVFYLYPNILKQNAQKFYESVERERKKESLSDIHHRFAVTQILGKRCEIFANSFFSQFRHLYKPGDPCHFQIRLQLANGATEEIPDLEGFLIHDFAIMEKSELTRKDLEYELDKILR